MHAECTRFCCVTGEDAARGRGTDGCMDGSFSFLSFIFFLFVASARGPQSSLQSASISMALCVNAPPEARVKLSPAQTPAKPITASLDHRHSLSLQLLHSIHYAANSPSCSTLDSLFTPYICSSHMPTHSPCWAQLFIRSCRHSISHAAQTVSNQALIHAGHIKLPPMYFVVEVID